MKRNDDGAWTRFKTRAESMESKKGDNIVISIGLLLVIIVALSLSGCANTVPPVDEYREVYYWPINIPEATFRTLEDQKEFEKLITDF